MLTLPKQIKLVPFPFCADVCPARHGPGCKAAGRCEGISTLEQCNAEPQSHVKQHMSLLKKKNPQPWLLASAMIATCRRRVARPIQEIAVETIQAGEFIDFADKGPSQGHIQLT